MSRIINPESAGKERTRLTKAIVLSIRQLAKQSEVTAESKDLAAFIALALKAVAEGIDASVLAWEKRDYWVKADRFRMEWAWADPLSDKMKLAVLTNDWGSVAMCSSQIAQYLNKIKVSDKHRMGAPWVGAYQKVVALENE